jgi:hypothetical protein
MHRMPTIRRTSRLTFRSSIRRTLAVLYKRRAEIEDLIGCLESHAPCCQNGGRFEGDAIGTSSQLGKVNEKGCRQFHQRSNESVQIH